MGVTGRQRIRLIVVRYVDPRDPDRLPDGIEAAPPYLPAVDRRPGETWEDFVDRIGDMLPDDAPVISVYSLLPKFGEVSELRSP
jgi:hypothetical protein